MDEWREERDGRWQRIFSFLCTCRGRLTTRRFSIPIIYEYNTQAPPWCSSTLAYLFSRRWLTCRKFEFHLLVSSIVEGKMNEWMANTVVGEMDQNSGLRVHFILRYDTASLGIFFTASLGSVLVLCWCRRATERKDADRREEKRGKPQMPRWNEHTSGAEKRVRRTKVKSEKVRKSFV